MNQQAILNILMQKATRNNPVVNNALNMFQNGNSSGLEQLARNLCQSKGINPEEALRNVQNRFR